MLFSYILITQKTIILKKFFIHYILFSPKCQHNRHLLKKYIKKRVTPAGGCLPIQVLLVSKQYITARSICAISYSIKKVDNAHSQLPIKEKREQTTIHSRQKMITSYHNPSFSSSLKIFSGRCAFTSEYFPSFPIVRIVPTCVYPKKAGGTCVTISF